MRHLTILAAALSLCALGLGQREQTSISGGVRQDRLAARGFDRPEWGPIKLWFSMEPGGGVDSVAFQYQLPDSETWLPETPVYATVDTNGIVEQSIDTADSLEGDYNVRALLMNDGAIGQTLPIPVLPVDNDSMAIFALSGYAIQDSTLTITGRRFGVKETAAPLIWDDFESGEDGTLLTSTSFWGIESDNPDSCKPRFDALASHSGQQSALFSYHRPTWYSHDLIHYADEAWAAARVLYFYGWARANVVSMAGTTSLQWKMWRWRGRLAGLWNPSLAVYSWMSSAQYPSRVFGQTYCSYQDDRCLTSPQVGCTGATTWRFNYAAPCVQHMEWAQLEQVIDVGTDTDGGAVDGGVFGTINGVLHINQPNSIKPYVHPDSQKVNVLLVGEFCGNADAAYMRTRWDDVYADTTQARVMLTASPNWNRATRNHREIQPATSWSPTSISVTFNKGSFANRRRAYLYVIRADGSISNSGIGVPIYIGARFVPKDEGAGGYETGELRQARRPSR